YSIDGSPLPVTLNTTTVVVLTTCGAAGAAGAVVAGAVVGAPLGVPVAPSSVTCVQVAGPQMSLIALRSGTITADWADVTSEVLSSVFTSSLSFDSADFR